MRVSTQNEGAPGTFNPPDAAGEAVGPALPYVLPPSGHRLPAAKRLGPVRLRVADLDRSIAFYEGVLGLRTLARAGADA